MAFPKTGVHLHLAHTIPTRIVVDPMATEIPVSTLMTNDSETLVKDGVSRLVGESHTRFGNTSVVITAFSDGWIATGREPDAKKDPRFPVRAGDTRRAILGAGDKIAWAAA